MIKIGNQNYFTSDDVEIRNNTIQRAINLLTDPDKFERFNRDMNIFIDRFEKINGKNQKVKEVGL